jgi:predicted signal transduction protein with EAL and GGDEF domain
MKNVDVALYNAKSAGRGTFAVFEPERDKTRGKRHFAAA